MKWYLVEQQKKSTWKADKYNKLGVRAAWWGKKAACNKFSNFVNDKEKNFRSKSYKKVGREASWKFNDITSKSGWVTSCN